MKVALALEWFIPTQQGLDGFQIFLNTGLSRLRNCVITIVLSRVGEWVVV